MIPVHWHRPFARPLPNKTQTQVLTAIFAPDDEARTSFTEWRSTLDLEGPFDPLVFALLPLLYLRLSELNIEDSLMPRLKGVCRHVWARNSNLLHKTVPAVAILERAGIPTLILKGAPLALTIYAALEARPMEDLDVVVPTNRLADAIRALEAAGWKSDKIMSYAHATMFRHASGGEFDLHWHIMMETVKNTVEDQFWQTAVPLDLAGVSTQMLHPAFSLVHILVHGLRSNPVPPIRWIPDALILIKRCPDLDWNSLVATSRAARVTQRVHIGLRYLATHFNAAVPANVLDALASSRPGFIERAETAAVLRETRGLAGNAVTKPVILLADYVRQAEERGLRCVPELFGYIRRRLTLTWDFKIR